MRFIEPQSCLALGLIWSRSQMPGWGWWHQSHLGCKLKVNSGPFHHYRTPDSEYGARNLHLYFHTAALSQHSASFMPHQTAPGRASHSLASLPPSWGLGLSPHQVLLLLNPETSLTLSHRSLRGCTSGNTPPWSPRTRAGFLRQTSHRAAQLGPDRSPLDSGSLKPLGLSRGGRRLSEGQSCCFATWGHICPRPRCSQFSGSHP